MAKTTILDSAVKAQEKMVKDREKVLAKARIEVEEDWKKKEARAEAETKERNRFVKEQVEINRRIEADKERHRQDQKAHHRMENEGGRPTPEETEQIITNARKRWDGEQAENFKKTRQPRQVKATEIGTIAEPPKRKVFKAKSKKYGSKTPKSPKKTSILLLP